MEACGIETSRLVDVSRLAVRVCHLDKSRLHQLYIIQDRHPAIELAVADTFIYRPVYSAIEKLERDFYVFLLGFVPIRKNGRRFITPNFIHIDFSLCAIFFFHFYNGLTKSLEL